MCPTLPELPAARPVLLCRGLGRAGHRVGHHGEGQNGRDGGGQPRVSEIYPG